MLITITTAMKKPLDSLEAPSSTGEESLGAERMGPGMSFHHCGNRKENSLDWDFVVVLARRMRRSWEERRGLAGV
ncbi:unnamed protein product [Boreogadus saida]